MKPSFHNLIPFLPPLLNHSTAISRDSLQLRLRVGQRLFTTGGLPPISTSWYRVHWDSGPEFFFSIEQLRHSPYITSSLTRGWVCHLRLLLALASAFILGSESRGIRDYILLTQIRDIPFCRLLRLAGLRWRYSISQILVIQPRGGPRRRHFLSAIVPLLGVVTETCLPNSFLEMDVTSGSTFRRRVTILS
jgi:hypothetical protein